jgi:hypothetical protein
MSVRLFDSRQSFCSLDSVFSSIKLNYWDLYICRDWVFNAKYTKMCKVRQWSICVLITEQELQSTLVAWKALWVPVPSTPSLLHSLHRSTLLNLAFIIFEAL